MESSSSSSTNDEPKPKRTKTTINHRSLNDFPEHLLLHILSFLPTVDAIKTTSSISRRWRNLWSSIPTLTFSYDHFPPSHSRAHTRRRFADAVNQTLLRRRIPPQSPPLLAFRLLFDFGEIKYKSTIESWIEYAVNHGVHELDVDFFPDRENRYDFLEGGEDPVFDFLFHQLQNAQVRVLRLSRCYLYWPDYMSTLKFASIRSVSLDQSYLGDSMLSDLLNGCSNLESLSLRFCWGMENAKYFGSKLKTLSLKHFQGVAGSSSVVIDCPNLVSLEFYAYVVEKYTLNYSPALVEASVNFAHMLEEYPVWTKVVKLLGHVEKLSVQNWWYKLLERNDVFSASFKLYNVGWLELKTGYTKSELHGIAVLLELSPNLETLILDYLDKLDSNEDEDGNENEDESLPDKLLNKPINFSLPRLRQAKLKAFAGTEKEYLVLGLLKKQGVVCQKIEVFHLENWDGSIDPPEVWVRKAEVQGSSPHWEQLSSN